MNVIGDIPVDPVMRHLLKIGAWSWESGQFKRWGTWFPGFDNSVTDVMPSGTSELRARAFMKILGVHGLIDGCHCGCRGDYQLTQSGLEYAQALPVLH